MSLYSSILRTISEGKTDGKFKNINMGENYELSFKKQRSNQREPQEDL